MLVRLLRMSSPLCPSLFLDCRLQGKAHLAILKQDASMLSLLTDEYRVIDTLLTDRQLMLQEELEHRYLREFAGWGGNSFELVSFFQRRNPEVSALGRLHYDCYHHTGKSSYPCTEDNISTIIRLSGLTRHGNYLFHAVFVEST